MPRPRVIHLNPKAPLEAGERIRKARALSGLSRPEIEKLHGIKNTTVAKWETGGSMLSIKGAHQLVQAFKSHFVFCSSDWLLYGRGDEPRVATLPDTSSYPVRTEDIDPEILLMEEMKNFRRLYPDAAIHLVNDDAMMPQFSMGDYVGGIKIKEDNAYAAFNKPCITEDMDGRKRLRIILPGSQKGLYHLCGTNGRAQAQPFIAIDVSLKYIATLIWHRFVG